MRESATEHSRATQPEETHTSEWAKQSGALQASGGAGNAASGGSGAGSGREMHCVTQTVTLNARGWTWCVGSYPVTRHVQRAGSYPVTRRVQRAGSGRLQAQERGPCPALE